MSQKYIDVLERSTWVEVPRAKEKIISEPICINEKKNRSRRLRKRWCLEWDKVPSRKDAWQWEQMEMGMWQIEVEVLFLLVWFSSGKQHQEIGVTFPYVLACYSTRGHLHVLLLFPWTLFLIWLQWWFKILKHSRQRPLQDTSEYSASRLWSPLFAHMKQLPLDKAD